MSKPRKKTRKTSAKQPKLQGTTRSLASQYIAEEMRTQKYPRKQAIAIGISRARAKTKKERQKRTIDAIMRKYHIT